jgi:long-chain acyl-CoA synthetase
MSKNYSSVLEYLIQSSKSWKDKEALVIRRRIKKETVYYKDLPDLLKSFEAWFNENKIPRGSKILLWGMNCPEYALMLLACMSLDRIAVPIDWRNSQETINKVIDKTNPKVAFISKYFVNSFLQEKGLKIYYLEELFDLIRKVSIKNNKLLKDEGYKSSENTAEIVFTSGTTGAPKGVVMKQKNIIANLKSVEPSLPDLSGSRTISILPLSHMLEQVAGLLLPLGQGATIYYLPKINSFRLLQSFSEYKPTHLVFVPQMLKIFWEKLEDKAKEANKHKSLQKAMKLSHLMPKPVKRKVFSSIHKLFGGNLDFIACGGAPLDKNVGSNWFKVGIPIVEGYGATEVTAVSTMNDISSPKLGSVGKPIPGVKIQTDENGEIFIQGSSLSAGYYNDKEKTRKAFTKKGYKTGDIGEFDNEGYLYIKGRDVYKIVLPSGEKVFVEDLETKIIDDKRVKEACVVAIRTSGGDKVHAYFILRKGVKENLKNIVSDINTKLESKQQISSYAIWPGEDFPRTPTYKFERKVVFEIANKEKGFADLNVQSTDGAYSIRNIVDILSKVSGIDKERISDSDTLSGDLDIDSLTRVEVVALAEEHLGVLLDEGKINAKTTVGELIKMAENAAAVEEIKLPMWQFTKIGEVLHLLSIKYLLSPLHSTIIKINYPQKRIPKIDPGSVVIFNHPGILDGACVVRTLLKQNQWRMVTNSSAGFWENKTPLARPLELFIGGIPLYDSGHKLMKVLQTDSDLLDRGYNLLFAPQGGLQTSSEEKPFKLGIGYIIRELDCPVHIIKIEGYYDLWPVPQKGLDKSNILDLLPRKTGAVNVKVSNNLKLNWHEMTPIQVTNYLEEKYKEL